MILISGSSPVAATPERTTVFEPGENCNLAVSGRRDEPSNNPSLESRGGSYGGKSDVDSTMVSRIPDNAWMVLAAAKPATDAPIITICFTILQP